MPPATTCAELADMFDGAEPFALIDVREVGEYNASHITGASLIPRRELEFRIAASVPQTGTRVVLCDDDGRRAALAARTLRRLGYANASALDGGMNRWASERRPTEWGVNVPSKDFGEMVQVRHHVPEIDSAELRRRMDRGDELVILDTRTPEEYARNCIPGGRSVPNGELGLRFADILADAPDDATVVINCAGRTRSIIGTRLLQRMGVENVVGLENGTAGWVLAGYELERGADRLDLPQPTREGRAAAERFADDIAAEDGVRYIGVGELDALFERAESESVYFVDVRSAEEHEAGRIPRFVWFPGGQAVQRADELAVVKNAPIVFACDGRARAALTASWYRQMGFGEVYALRGGTQAWLDAGRALERGALAPPTALGGDATPARSLSAADLANALDDVALVHVGLSAEFAQAHIPTASWVPRGWLEFRIADAAPDKSAPVAAICADGGAQAALAAATLTEMGYANAAYLEGGMEAWIASGGAVEQGLSGVMSPPNDTLASGAERSFADMVNYLRWEEELGRKYA